MFTEETRVLYQGFHPSEQTMARLQRMAEALHEEAPSHACVKATYSRHGREYHADIRITSRAGHFHALTRGSNLYVIGKDAMKRVRRQLQKWKTRRMNHDTLNWQPETSNWQEVAS